MRSSTILADKCFEIQDKTFLSDGRKAFELLFAAMNLMRCTKLGATISRAFAAASGCLELASSDLSTLRVASGAASCRKQTLVDAALCCCWADHLSKFTSPICAYAKSAPQTVGVWLLSDIQLFKECYLHECLMATGCMCSSVEEFKNGKAKADARRILQIAQETHDDDIFLKSAFKRHKQLPMALGSCFFVKRSP